MARVHLSIEFKGPVPVDLVELACEPRVDALAPVRHFLGPDEVILFAERRTIVVVSPTVACACQRRGADLDPGQRPARWAPFRAHQVSQVRQLVGEFDVLWVGQVASSGLALAYVLNGIAEGERTIHGRGTHLRRRTCAAPSRSAPAFAPPSSSSCRQNIRGLERDRIRASPCEPGRESAVQAPRATGELRKK